MLPKERGPDIVPLGQGRTVQSRPILQYSAEPSLNVSPEQFVPASAATPPPDRLRRKAWTTFGTLRARSCKPLASNFVTVAIAFGIFTFHLT